MYSLSKTCAACGTVNQFVVQGYVLPIEEIHCSRCLEPMGTWGDLIVQAMPSAPNEGSPSDQRQT